VDVLPGANAVLTAFVASGFVTTKFLFFGFLPHKGKERENALQEALYSGYTTILYEAPHRIDVLIKRLAEVAPDRIVFLAKELTKKHQTFYKDSVQNLANQLNTINTKGEWVVVIEAGEQRQQSSLSVDDILALKLAPKQSAKLLSKLTGQPVKEWYNKLLSHD
jgi:16S rRNA (cytidine1402-2'-O)-methyltransferase